MVIFVGGSVSLSVVVSPKLFVSSSFEVVFSTVVSFSASSDLVSDSLSVAVCSDLSDSTVIDSTVDSFVLLSPF